MKTNKGVFETAEALRWWLRQFDDDTPVVNGIREAVKVELVDDKLEFS